MTKKAKFIFAKFAPIISLVAVSSSLFGQSSIMLGDAQAVDIRVKDVQWNPNGKVFLYSRETESGLGIGVYGSGNKEGKVVFPIQVSDSWDVNWLADSTAAIVVVKGLLDDAHPNSVQAKIYLVDGESQSARALFSQVYDIKSVPSIDVNQSPSLKHAIVAFNFPSGITHKVLCSGARTLIDSPDLDKATSEGLRGPNWSIDGTAIYSKPQPGAPDKFTILGEGPRVPDSDSRIEGYGNPGTINTTYTSMVNGELVTLVKSLKIRIDPPMPSTGSTVFELMPANPMLRPIRFRGPWVWPKSPASTLIPQNQPLTLRFDQSNAQDSSIWLTRGKEKGLPATLVAVHASQTWMSDSKTGIAYLIDGALFFRSIGK